MKVKFSKNAVAFIDVLGFENFLRKAELDGSEESIKFSTFLDEISKNPVFNDENGENIFFPAELELVTKHISDSFIVCSPCDENQKLPALIAVSIKAIQIFQALLEIGFASRGGIAVGSLYVMDNNIFGSAYMNAIKTEKAAIYPRILLHESALGELNMLCQYKYRHDPMFSKLHDEVFLDSFFDLTLISKNNFDISSKMGFFKACIEKNLKDTIDNRDREKWRWIALYFNAHSDYFSSEIERISVKELLPIEIDYLNHYPGSWLVNAS